ncbi:MAG: glycosyltransferase family 8 protein [Synechococcales bacterium]|nr:glycosyltransferase family 8 protein [Synechococcales bacterium]
MIASSLDALQQDSISIVCCSDEQYVPLMATMLTSLVKNHLSPEVLDIYVINDGILEATKQSLASLFPPQFIRIFWLDFDPKEVTELLGIPSRYSQLSCHFYRLLMSKLLPETVSQVIYLDADLIVLGNIADLWKTDLQGKIVGAVQDFLETCGNAISNCQELGISPTAKYFNSGVLLIDLEKWRKQDISKRAIVCRLENEEAVRAGKHYSYDQFGLNVVLNDQWEELDPRWNYSPGPGKLNADPWIVHYYGDVKPWSMKCLEEFRQKFLYYLDQTVYKNYFQSYFEKVAP